MAGHREKPMPKWAAPIAKNIQSVRKYYGMSQAELARRLGCSPALIAWWETNRSTPRAEQIVMMCYIFGCSADDLLGVPRKWVKIK